MTLSAATRQFIDPAVFIVANAVNTEVIAVKISVKGREADVSTKGVLRVACPQTIVVTCPSV